MQDSGEAVLSLGLLSRLNVDTLTQDSGGQELPSSIRVETTRSLCEYAEMVAKGHCESAIPPDQEFPDSWTSGRRALNLIQGHPHRPSYPEKYSVGKRVRACRPNELLPVVFGLLCLPWMLQKILAELLWLPYHPRASKDVHEELDLVRDP